ncbi:oxidative damage protection protein [Enterobacteriaceae endosymbiont of Donacia versicolorea]|uniref:oxidative damage protection protein n=1 Tax=Enterobacteriaceae endosymbiont of Donacia versicolorea TaxID=2675788 RepID=UPI001449B4FF|nr:oxidative damage protection protein [Enterobacteriaceae endosymbiont of Donacia versicolorea]QJC32141.1 oxidative damage protection protein [Enterobacteriaceae endosymbiont of Donacia versicolorea]
MSKKIFCIYFQKRLEQLNHKVYPGNIGNIIFYHISKKAWSEWIIHQTKIINEKKLNMIKEKNIIFLENKMIKFLFCK